MYIICFFYSESKCPIFFYQDLKKYHYCYWFAFPALLAPEGTKLIQPPEKLDKAMDQDKVSLWQNSQNAVLGVITYESYCSVL